MSGSDITSPDLARNTPAERAAARALVLRRYPDDPDLLAMLGLEETTT